MCEEEMKTQTNNRALDRKQQGIVTIAAFTAKGDMSNLKEALSDGLEAGLTINEIKEVLVQLYAYCGFPRSINGLVTFMSVVEERKASGKTDITGKDASYLADTGNKYKAGKSTLEALTKRHETGPKTGLAAFAPIIDTFLKEHLFADIFSRDVLTYAQREIATIAALSALGGVEAQLQAHLGMGLNVGITEEQLEEIMNLIEANIGVKEAATGRETLSKVLSSR
jgi:alkylhydroperoxidase/carboxymuconolactone decarboxylase family protein YurZ